VSTRSCPPAPSCILESLRGLGYTLPTALADLVDNSIAASATEIDVHVEWLGRDSWISVADNGAGMTDAELESAMRLGSRNPRETRALNDLGRFGLGLKTASLSQGRRLTVATKTKDGSESCLRWDLDLLENDTSANWTVYEGPAHGSNVRLEPLQSAVSGTVVLIENLDRIVTANFSREDMVQLVDEVDAHLGMVFHRLMAPSEPQLKIRINGRVVRGWDPFLIGHPGKAMESAEYTLFDGSPVQVQLHVLPHRDLLSADEFSRAGGPAGWVQQQGMYVYRNKRMLVAGGWLGLGESGRLWARDEAHRLARIRVDIANGDDAEWKIDVRKSAAVPPVRLKKQLVRLARETRDAARRAFAGRGVIVTNENRGAPKLPDPWATVRSTSGTAYKIARDHDLIASVIARAGDLRSDLIAIFRLLEETLPVQRIWVDTAEERETPRVGFTDAKDEDVLSTLQSLFHAIIVGSKITPDEARDRLRRTPPFIRYTHLIDTLDAPESP
jgi:hypothetical protein